MKTLLDQMIILFQLMNYLISYQIKMHFKAINFKDRINEVKLANCSADKAKKIMGYRKSISLDDSCQK